MKEIATWESLQNEIQERMLKCQVEQGNPRDENVFKYFIISDFDNGGFTWDDTIEKQDFWQSILADSNFELFFERYPNNVTIQVPMTFFAGPTQLLLIGIFDNLTIERKSVQVEEQRTFTFAPEIFPAVKLMFQRMFDVENVEIFIIS